MENRGAAQLLRKLVCEEQGHGESRKIQVYMLGT